VHATTIGNHAITAALSANGPAIRTFQLASVVIATLRDLKLLGIPAACHPIDQTVFQCDPARPPTSKLSSQRLGLASPFERRSHALLDETIHAL
jgi:hypothetical protein